MYVIPKLTILVFLSPLLYVSDVKITQTLLTPNDAQIPLFFFLAWFSVKKNIPRLPSKYWEKLRHCKETALVLIFYFKWIID